MRPLFIYILTVLLVSFSFSATAQLEKAKKLEAERSYFDAIKVYEKIIIKNPANREALKGIANCYRELKQNDKAEGYYNSIINIPPVSPDELLTYGLILKSNNKIKESKVQFLKYLETNPGSLFARLQVQACDRVVTWNEELPLFNVKSLKNINTGLADYSPIFYDNGLVFTTEREVDEVNDRHFEWTNAPYLSIYYAPLLNAELDSFGKAVPFGGIMNGDYHDGPVSISTSKGVAFFCRSEPTGGKKDPTIKMYMLTLKGKHWTKMVPFTSNSENYSVMHPCLSPDGNTVYFASNMPGGYGGMDIYSSLWDGNVWSQPKNMGPSINTSANEVFPFYKNEREFYFSSNGHPGYGGLDIFVYAPDSLGNEPYNLKTPLNTTHDDFGIFFISPSKGFFSSNKIGGIGSDDIYGFERTPYQPNESYNELAGVFEYNGLPGANSTLILVDENDNLVAKVFTDNNGKFTFNKLLPNKDYIVKLSKGDTLDLDYVDIFITNSKGEKILLASRNDRDGFQFKALPKDQIESLPLFTESDRPVTNPQLFGQIFRKLPGDVNEPTMIYAYDETSYIIDSTLSDEIGKFNFGRKITSKIAYLKIPASDSLTVAMLDKQGQLSDAAYETADGKYIFRKLANGTTLVAFINEDEEGVPITGVFEYNQLKKSGISLMLLDENDNVIDVATTDENGKFNFNKLPPNTKYKIVPYGLDSLDFSQAMIFFTNEEGEKTFAYTASGNEFKFKTLDPLNSNQLTNLNEIDALLSASKFKGQVYRSLPGDVSNITTVYAVDETGDIIATAYTDEYGNFSFEKLPSNTKIFFKLDSTLTDAKIDVVNDKQEILATLSQDTKKGFAYKRLSPMQSEMAMIEKDIDGNVKVKGVFTYNTLPASGVKLKLIDENDNTIGYVITDEFGQFDFGNLPPNKQYNVQVVDGQGSINEDAKVVLTGKDNNILMVIERSKNGGFQFQKLDKSPVTMAMIESENDKINVKGVFTFNELPAKNVKLKLLDENDEVIEIITTDENGKFDFGKLPGDKKYIILLAEEDTVLANTRIYLTDSQDEIMSAIVRNKEGKFVFAKLALNDVDINKVDGKEGDFRVKGVFQYNQLPTSGVLLDLVDDQDNVIGQVMTDAFGKFDFGKLPPDKNYIIRMAEVDESGEIPIRIYLTDEKNKISQAITSEDGKIEFGNESVEPSNIFISRTSFTTVTGIFEYNKLPAQGESLELVDANYNVIAKVRTDANGVFKFDSVPSGPSYRLHYTQTDNKSTIENPLIYFIAASGSKVAISSTTAVNRKYEFKCFDEKSVASIATLTTPEGLNNGFTVYGEIYDKTPGDVTKPLKIFCLNEAGIIVATAISNPKGRFQVNKLSIYQRYTFKLEQENINYVISLIGYDGNLVKAVLRNVKDQFDLRPLAADKSGINFETTGEEIYSQIAKTVNEKDNSKSQIQVKRDIILIYYDFDSVLFSNQYQTMIEQVAKELKENLTLKVNISSFADSRGSEEYNMKLTKQRTSAVVRYLRSLGVNKEQIVGEWFGEERLVNDCGNSKYCSNEQHALNRRTEIKFIETTDF